MKRKKKKNKKPEQNKLITVTLIVVSFVLVGLIIILSADPFTYGDYYLGTTISSFQQHTHYGSKTRIVVQLDDGRKVDVKQTVPMGPIMKGKRLILQECITMILKRKSFQFIKYVDDNSKLDESKQLIEVINKNGA